MEWKKLSFFEALNKTTYSDNYGISRIAIRNIIVNYSNSYGNFLIEWNKLYFDRGDGNYKNFHDIDEFACHIFKSNIGKSLKRTDFPQILPESEIYLLTINDYKVKFSTGHSDLGLSKNDIEKLSFYYNEEFNYDIKLQKVNLYEIAIGKKYFLKNIGTVTVETVNEYPQKDEIFCIVKDMSNNLFEIHYNAQELMYLPMETKENEINKFNQSLNELLLQPRIVKEDQLYNIYWQEIEDAAQYVVELYKIIDRPCMKNIYHLKRYYLDRDTRYLAVRDLIGNEYIFVVKAEDRNGNVIALSRGIELGEPKWW